MVSILISFIISITTCLNGLQPGAHLEPQTPSDWTVDVHTVPGCEEVGVVYYTVLPK